ncbi:MAG: hypothetical protein RL143_238 [Pseudomonadota bacterium]
MFSAGSLSAIVIVYMGMLFALAVLVERYARKRSGLRWQGAIYALSLAVFFTSWTFYGSVGFAIANGAQFFAIYIGAIAGLILGAGALKRMVLAKESFRLTSIADLISTRYRRSQRLAALVSILAMIGLAPYIVLQLRAIDGAFEVLTGEQSSSGNGLIVTLLMALLTIMFGARRVDPTERHQGIIAVLAAESLIKLLAFIAVGLFVTYGLFDGFQDLHQKIQTANLEYLYSAGQEGSGYTWVALIILGAAAILMLPRQFHVTVVENADSKHIKSAIRLFPIYTIAINLFVIPVAAAGLLLGLPATSGDQFVLLIPQMSGSQALTLVAFIGGFAAATGMIIVTTLTLATMASNHLVIPIWRRIRPDTQLAASLLQIRWGLIVLILLLAFTAAEQLQAPYILVSLGLISFAAVLQLAPAGLIGLFWKTGNSLGAALGLLTGYLVWYFTLVVPPMVGEGWIDQSVMTQGFMGYSWLRPQAMFGFDFLPPLAHGVFWSLLFNLGFYWLGSKLYRPRKVERALTAELFNAMREEMSDRYRNARPTGLEAYIEREPKIQEAEKLLSRYLSDEKAEEMLGSILNDLQLGGRSHLTVVELMEFHRMIEHRLAGSIGAAGAHSAIEDSISYSDRESADLRALFSHLASELKLSQSDGRGQQIVSGEGSQFFRELQKGNEILNNEIAQLRNANKVLDEKLDRQYQEIFKYRLEAQRLNMENEALKAQLTLEIGSRAIEGDAKES